MACERSDGDGKTGRGKEGKGSGGWDEEREMRREEWWAITEVAAEQMGPHLGSSHGKWLWMNVRNWGKGSKAGDPWGLMIPFISLFCCLATSRYIVLFFDCTIWSCGLRYSFKVCLLYSLETAIWLSMIICQLYFSTFFLLFTFNYLLLFFNLLFWGLWYFAGALIFLIKWSLPLMVAWKEQMWTGQIISSPASMCRCSWAQHSEEFVLSKCVLVEFRPAKK